MKTLITKFNSMPFVADIMSKQIFFLVALSLALSACSLRISKTISGSELLTTDQRIDEIELRDSTIIKFCQKGGTVYIDEIDVEFSNSIGDTQIVNIKSDAYLITDNGNFYVGKPNKKAYYSTKSKSPGNDIFTNSEGYVRKDTILDHDKLMGKYSCSPVPDSSKIVMMKSTNDSVNQRLAELSEYNCKLVRKVNRIIGFDARYSIVDENLTDITQAKVSKANTWLIVGLLVVLIPIGLIILYYLLYLILIIFILWLFVNKH